MKKSAKADDRRLIVLESMKKEQKRAFSRLRIDDFERPYFIGYTTKYRDTFTVGASLGAVDGRFCIRSGLTYADVRVGSYEFDQSVLEDNIQSLLKDIMIDKECNFLMPIEEGAESIRVYLWRLTDLRYKDALARFYEKKGQKAQEPAGKVASADFSREKGIVHIDPPPSSIADEAYWEETVRRISRGFRKCRKLTASRVSFDTSRLTKFIVTTEGSEIITENLFYHVIFEAAAYAEDGMPLKITRCLSFRSLAEIPGNEALEFERERLMEDIMNLQNAPVLEPYSGPALLEPLAAGIFFHEAIGHRLEGERQLSKEEGRTFGKRIGEKILPDNITIIDDPSIKSFNGKSLTGSYLFDDQGVPSQGVVLVRDGVLQNFLLSRTPVEGFTRSNGHGRNQLSLLQQESPRIQTPRARMANFFITAKQGHSRDELKEMLMREVTAKKKSYGLIIRDAESGETNTSTYGFQAFNISPRMVYRVDADSGRETLVRGVSFVGTPLSAIDKLIAFGDSPEAHNGVCGAESGLVNISTVSPSVLIEGIELQKQNGKRDRPPILPIPLRG